MFSHLTLDRDLRRRALEAFERDQEVAVAKERVLIGLAGTVSIVLFGSLIAAVLSW